MINMSRDQPELLCAIANDRKISLIKNDRWAVRLGLNNIIYSQPHFLRIERLYIKIKSHWLSESLCFNYL